LSQHAGERDGAIRGEVVQLTHCWPVPMRFQFSRPAFDACGSPSAGHGQALATGDLDGGNG
jgi:hypothetical protein